MSETRLPDDEPRILIAEGPWSMQENYLHHGSLGEDVLGYDIMVHKCKWKDNWFLKTHNVSVFMMLSDDPVCLNCNEKVPNMMKTLWTLKNLDKIQDGANYGDKKAPWGYGPSTFYTGLFYSTLLAKPGQTFQYIPQKTKP